MTPVVPAAEQLPEIELVACAVMVVAVLFILACVGEWLTCKTLKGENEFWRGQD